MLQVEYTAEKDYLQSSKANTITRPMDLGLREVVTLRDAQCFSLECLLCPLTSNNNII